MLAEIQERAKAVEFKGVDHYKCLGCRNPAVPQEALDVTVRTRDSHRHGADTRASSDALLEDLVALWHPQEKLVAVPERGTHVHGRNFPRPCDAR